jgi:hypothetical protein
VATPALCPRIAGQGRPRRASLLTFQSQGLPAAQLISVVDAAGSIHREIYSRCFLALSFRQLPGASEAPPAFLHRFRRGAGAGSIQGSVARLTVCRCGCDHETFPYRDSLTICLMLLSGGPKRPGRQLHRQRLSGCRWPGHWRWAPRSRNRSWLRGLLVGQTAPPSLMVGCG